MSRSTQTNSAEANRPLKLTPEQAKQAFIQNLLQLSPAEIIRRNPWTSIAATATAGAVLGAAPIKALSKSPLTSRILGQILPLAAQAVQGVIAGLHKAHADVAANQTDTDGKPIQQHQPA